MKAWGAESCRTYGTSGRRHALPRRRVPGHAEVKISPRRLASSRHFLSSPLRRTERMAFQRFQRLDLDPQLRDRPRGGGLVENLLLGGLDFVVGGFLQVLDIFLVETGTAGTGIGAAWPPR